MPFRTSARWTLTNLSSPFYGGRLEGDLRVESSGKRDPDIRFNARVRACQLRPLISDLVSPTNKLEGTLSGEWNVTFGGQIPALHAGRDSGVDRALRRRNQRS